MPGACSLEMGPQGIGHQADGQHAGNRNRRRSGRSATASTSASEEGRRQCRATRLLAEPQQRHRNGLSPRLAAASGDQDGGDDQQCAERAEPDRHAGRERLEIGDDEGDEQQRADGNAADAAVFRGQQLAAIAQLPATARKPQIPPVGTADSAIA